MITILTLILSFIYLREILHNTRAFINHDDLDFIRPLLSMDWQEYWSIWLPDRDHYAFPLRDLTFFLDKSLSDIWGLNIFWISNFLYFLISVFAFTALLKKNFSGDRLLLIAAAIILWIHPLNVELIQWATFRKYVTAFIPIAVGTYLLTDGNLRELHSDGGLSSLGFGWPLSLATPPQCFGFFGWLPAVTYSIEVCEKQSYKPPFAGGSPCSI